jgi:hypothetical protein
MGICQSVVVYGIAQRELTELSSSFSSDGGVEYDAGAISND